MTRIIELTDVYKTYHLGETLVKALRGVSLCIDEGDLVAVWGPSGSGKSTLLNIIGLIDAPSMGSLSLNGNEVGVMSDNAKTDLRSRYMGFIFQNFNLMPILTALENVMLPLQVQGVSVTEARARAMSSLQSVGMEKFIQHRPDKLSGGQRQRVAIARGLVTGPKLLICDEPTANLDFENAERVMDLMCELNDKLGITFLFSTHDTRLIGRVKRIIYIEDGSIVKDEKK